MNEDSLGEEISKLESMVSLLNILGIWLNIDVLIFGSYDIESLSFVVLVIIK